MTKQPFLELYQPIPLPSIENEGPHAVPFTFIVPEQLLPSSYGHEYRESLVKDSHLRLPPSLGDSALASDGVTLLDDMSANCIISILLGPFSLPSSTVALVLATMIG